ncbi:hypothetical protein ACFUT3_33990 [Streptomyces cinereoruber]|uniref:hypothetical protein n=1 Tax=Streptomyces cinereoruber TaxID=67260 RepID=UPI00363C1EE2
MTNVFNPNAFSFGSQERTSNFWATHMDPTWQAEREAKREAMEAEQRRVIAAFEDQQRAQEVMTVAGPALIDLIRGYDSQNKPAVTSQVRQDFIARLKGATEDEFNSTLHFLKETGIIHEQTAGMGHSAFGHQGSMWEQQKTHLYVIEDLG